MTPTEKQSYRSKRNGIGWALAGLWFLYWFMQPSDGWGVAYAGGVMLAIFTWPFAFIISHYIARNLVESESRAQAAQEAAAKAKIEQQERDEQDARMRAITHQADMAKGAIDRGEFIKKLGTVRDYLAVLDTTSDPDRQLLLRQSIDKELRDLIVKHSPDAMRALFARDEAVRVSLDALLRLLRERGSLSADAMALDNTIATATFGT